MGKDKSERINSHGGKIFPLGDILKMELIFFSSQKNLKTFHFQNFVQIVLISHEETHEDSLRVMTSIYFRFFNVRYYHYHVFILILESWSEWWTFFFLSYLWKEKRIFFLLSILTIWSGNWIVTSNEDFHGILDTWTFNLRLYQKWKRTK